MSDSVVVNVISPQTTSITVNDTGENIYINPLTLNQGIINHSVTHQSGGSDELFHNLLGGLQGGSSGNYYHLTSGQYANLVTGAVIRPSDTGAFYPNSNPSGFITGVNLSGYVTGDVVRPSQTGNFITTSQTGAFYAASNPSGFITGVDLSAYVTGDVVRPSETGVFYLASNPSGFITGVDLSAYVTGSVVRPNETGYFIDFNTFTGDRGDITITGTSQNDLNFSIDNLAVTSGKIANSAVTTNKIADFSITTAKLASLAVTTNIIASNSVTNVKLADMAQNTIKGRISVGTSDPEDLSSSQVRTLINFDSSVSGLLSGYVTGSVVRPSETGAFYAASNPSGFITGVDLSAYVTGLVVRPSETGNFITSSQTGVFYPTSNPSGFVTGSVVRPYETGSFITNSQTGVFYPTSNPSGFALTVSPARTTLTGDGATSIYAISGAGSLTNPSALIVATDGALQEPGVDYSVSGGYITFTSPLVSGAKSVVVSPTNTVQVLDMIPSDGSVTSAKLASGLSISSPTLTNAVIGGSTTFSTSGAATALNTSLGTRRVRRATIATRTSSSIIADDTLVLSVISGVSYRIKIHILTKNSTATVGMVLLLQHPGITATTSTEAVGHFTNNGGNAVVTPSTSTTLTNIVNQNGQNLSTIAEVIITPTASGNVTVMWGARVPAGVETAGLNANSYMEIIEIG